MDVTKDLSNKIINEFDPTDSFSLLCDKLKSKDLAYSRISRCLSHILLDITEKNMKEYKADNFTAYARVLGLKKDSSAILGSIHENASIPVIDRLKDAKNLLSPLQYRLFGETLRASSVYNLISENGIANEYSQKPIILP